MSECLVDSAAFKAVGTGDPRSAGSIPVHLRHSAKLTRGGCSNQTARRSRAPVSDDGWRNFDMARASI